MRGIGPSLTGLTPVLDDPVIELHGPNGSLITSNDNWKDSQQAEIENTTLAPSNDLEAAIIATLAPGTYTAILKSKTGTDGIGLIEMYDLDVATDSMLANISTRGSVQTGDEVMIAGFVFGNGTANEKIVIRVIGPSLTGILNVLADPTLELHDANGTLFMSNDNWKDDSAQAAELTSDGFAPANDLESAIVTTLPPGAYTAIVAGKNDGTGVAIAEMYHLQ